MKYSNPTVAKSKKVDINDLATKVNSLHSLVCFVSIGSCMTYLTFINRTCMNTQTTITVNMSTEGDDDDDDDDDYVSEEEEQEESADLRVTAAVKSTSTAARGAATAASGASGNKSAPKKAAAGAAVKYESSKGEDSEYR